MTHYVYFVKPTYANQRVFKIGETENIERRIRQLQSSEGIEILPISYIEVETSYEAKFLEKFLHNFLRGYKVIGKKDWYQYDTVYVLSLVDTIFALWQTNPAMLREHLDQCPYMWSKHLAVNLPGTEFEDETDW